MSSEILAVLEYMEKEKGISREDMIATIENAVKTAAERGVNSASDVRVEINEKTANESRRASSMIKVSAEVGSTPRGNPCESTLIRDG